MTDSFLVGAYWGPRVELLDECTERFMKFMTSLAGIEPLLATWCEPGKTRKEALAATINIADDTLRDLLFDGRHKSDDNARTVREQLGFHVSLWNGQETEVGLSIACGGWSPQVGNHALIELPSSTDPVAANLYEPETSLALVRATVSAWAPSKATWISHELREAQGVVTGGLVVGWVTYLAASRLAKAAGSLPASVRTEPLGDGLLIIIGDDPTSVPLALVMDVRAALGQALLPEW
jgi:Immunity protein 52